MLGRGEDLKGVLIDLPVGVWSARDTHPPASALEAAGGVSIAVTLLAAAGQSEPSA